MHKKKQLVTITFLNFLVCLHNQTIKKRDLKFVTEPYWVVFDKFFLDWLACENEKKIDAQK